MGSFIWRMAGHLDLGFDFQTTFRPERVFMSLTLSLGKEFSNVIEIKLSLQILWQFYCFKLYYFDIEEHIFDIGIYKRL